MNLKSVAVKNNLILILLLTPFIISLIFSIYKSSDTEYLSTSINISGSQRMRTMLLANNAQQLHNAVADGRDDEISEIAEILNDEVQIYNKYYQALLNGDRDLAMKRNPFPVIADELRDLSPQMEEYIDSVNSLLIDPMDREACEYIISNAMGIISNEVGIEDWDMMISLSDKLMYESKLKTDHVTACYTPYDLEDFIGRLKEQGLL